MHRLKTLLPLLLSLLLTTLCLSCTAEESAETTPSSTQETDTDTDGPETPPTDPSPEADAPSKAPAAKTTTTQGPRKIQRPTPKSQPDPTDESDPTPDTAAKDQAPNAPNTSADDEETPEVTEDASARQFDFDGTDEELEMILGTRDIPPFYIDDLLTKKDLQAALGSHTPTEIATLPGQEPSPYYNHRWFRSAQEDRLGVVFQYWHFQSASAATTHYELMERNAGVETKPVGVGSQAHYMERGDTTEVVALLLELRAVVAFTCDVENCHVPAIMRWIKNVEERAAAP